MAVIAFVDDTESLFISVDNDNTTDLIAQAEKVINVWREVLEITGEAMRPAKCSWTIMSYDDKKHSSHLISISKIPGDIFIPTEEGDLCSIERYSANVSRCYLGVEQRTVRKRGCTIPILTK